MFFLSLHQNAGRLFYSQKNKLLKKPLFAYEKLRIIMILCQTLVKIYNSIAQTNLCRQTKNVTH